MVSHNASVSMSFFSLITALGLVRARVSSLIASERNVRPGSSSGPAANRPERFIFNNNSTTVGPKTICINYN